MKNISLTLIVFLLFAVSCKKNINDSMVTDPPPPPVIGSNYNPIEIPITSSVVGIVIDENGQPVEGATVSLKDQTLTSDVFGSFRFMNAAMNENGTFIQIEKDGYFKSGRRFFPTSSATHNVRIELIEENFNQSFSSSDGGTMTFENGGEINFSPNSIKLENGDAYSGEVMVALKWLDPNADATMEQMPGALQGVTIQGEEMALETYGMIAVELESPIGESLNIANNETAQIKMPVPSSLLNNAPTEIPLWAFNYQYGIWAEDGKATLENGFYVGEVDHFSFWNCDFPWPVVDFSLTLIDKVTQEPLTETKVQLIISNSGVTSSGVTNANGIVAGKIPKGELLELQVLNICGKVIFNNTIGPYSNSASLSQEVEVNVGNEIIISGEIIDCAGDLATEGLLIVDIDNERINIPIENNPFEITIPTCPNTTEISVSGGNLSDFEQGDFFTVPVAGSVSVGSLVACGTTILGYGEVIVDNSTSKIVGPLQIINSANLGILVLWQVDGDTNILLDFPLNGIGDYSDMHKNGIFHISDLGFSSMQEFEIVKITDFGSNSGDLISGEFSGNLENTFGGEIKTTHISFKFSGLVE